MGSKVGKDIHIVRNVVPMHHGDRNHNVGQIKAKSCATVPKTNDRHKDN